MEHSRNIKHETHQNYQAWTTAALIKHETQKKTSGPKYRTINNVHLLDNHQQVGTLPTDMYMNKNLWKKKNTDKIQKETEVLYILYTIMSPVNYIQTEDT
jgi:hypothetical protein